MLWYKAWLETRWRFLIGLVLLVGSAGAAVLAYPQVIKLMPLAASVDLGGPLGDELRRKIELAREFRGYIWSQWFSANLRQLWTLLAVLLGTGGLLAEASAGAALFTLSMPVSRSRLLGVRAATGLAELLGLAIVPSLVVPLVSPVVGQSFSAGAAIVHGLCLFVAGAVFYNLALLLSTVFRDLWRPALGAICLWALVALGEFTSPWLAEHGLTGVMTGETYFRTGELPWTGLLASAALSAALVYTARVNLARHDF
jgi:ABC-2 type transport system permease protein